jgi:hypothetical protein
MVRQDITVTHLKLTWKIAKCGINHQKWDQYQEHMIFEVG